MLGGTTNGVMNGMKITLSGGQIVECMGYSGIDGTTRGYSSVMMEVANVILQARPALFM